LIAIGRIARAPTPTKQPVRGRALRSYEESCRTGRTKGNPPPPRGDINDAKIDDADETDL
jgi:hypothetical protein